MDVKKTSRQIQAETTKKNLLTVASKLIREQGFDHVKIEDICKAANISTGAFYHHIKNKAGLIVVGYSQCDEYFRDEVIPLVEERHDIEAVLLYLHFVTVFAYDYGVDLTIQIYKAQLTEEREFFFSEERWQPRGLFNLIKRCQEHNVLSSEIEAKDLANQLLIITRGVIFNWCQAGGTYELDVLAKTMLSNYLKGYTL